MTIDRPERFPLAVQVSYRTAGAFLVAYSANLSSGGMFLETEVPHPPGTQLNLTFTIPGSDPIEVRGVVAWTRPAPEGDQPAGMGVRFLEPLDAVHGERVDQIVSRFKGLCVVVLAESPQARSQLKREVRSMMKNASVIEAEDSERIEEVVQNHIDLLVVDMDDAPEEGIVALRLAKVAGPDAVPVIVTARSDATRERARELGADEVLTNPPPYSDLQAAVVRALSRPSKIG